MVSKDKNNLRCFVIIKTVNIFYNLPKYNGRKE